MESGEKASSRGLNVEARLNKTIRTTKTTMDRRSYLVVGDGEKLTLDRNVKKKNVHHNIIVKHIAQI